MARARFKLPASTVWILAMPLARKLMDHELTVEAIPESRVLPCLVVDGSATLARQKSQSATIDRILQRSPVGAAERGDEFTGVLISWVKMKLRARPVISSNSTTVHHVA